MKNINFKKIINIIICLIFFGFIVVFALLTIVLPKESFSELENTSLESMPKLTLKSWLDQSYAEKIEDYISDHFAGRTDWLHIKSGIEISLGKKERNGIYILDNRLIEKIGEPDYSSVDKNISAINTYADENNMPIYVMLAPTSAEFYKNELPSYCPELDQEKFIDYVYSGLNDNITPIDVYGTLDLHKSEYIYYRTDHHWTSLGAYYAYAKAGEKMGYIPNDLSYYDIEQASDSFMGTFYSKVLTKKADDDQIDFYHIPGSSPAVEVTTEFGQKPTVNNDLFFREYLSVKDKYSSFLGKNSPIVTIRTGNEGGKLLMFKDSYAHCYSQFLIDNYSEITMLDMRYIQMSYKKIIDISDYDETLILYNVSSFADDTDLRKLLYS